MEEKIKAGDLIIDDRPLDFSVVDKMTDAEINEYLKSQGMPYFDEIDNEWTKDKNGNWFISMTADEVHEMVNKRRKAEGLEPFYK